jgi:polysaccharide export outer membrane protein
MRSVTPNQEDTTIRHQILLLGICFLGTAGCSTLPRSGPYASDLTVDRNGPPKPFAGIEIAPAVVDTLERARPPSLAGNFGDALPSREHAIGIGDSVQITLWEAGPGGLFSAPVVDRQSAGSRSATIPDQVVAQDAAITVPFAGRIVVAGRSPPEVESIIVSRLAGKAIDPQALVTVTHNVSNMVTVMGEVASGRRVALDVGGDRLLDVLADAGGTRGAAYDTAVVLARGDRVARVPLQAILDDPHEDVFLQPADVVTLVADPQTFTAAGATGRNAVVPFETASLSLEEAIGKAGGVLDDRGDPDGVFVIRYEAASVANALPGLPPVGAARTPVVYHLKLRDPNAMFLARRFAMRNKDILYVSNAPLSDLQKVFSLINLLVAPAVSGAVINSNVK